MPPAFPGSRAWLIAATLAGAAVALAQSGEGPILTWTDDAGVTHYTDDPGAVPRGRKVRRTAGEALSVLEFRGGPPVDAGAPPADPPEDLPPQPDPRAAEQAWRSAFRAAQARVERLELQVEAERQALEEVNGMPVTDRQCFDWGAPPGLAFPGWPQGCAAWEAWRRQLEQDRADLVRAREALADLERQASARSVPREWRR